MTPLEYMEKMLRKQQSNLEKETARNAPEESLRNIRNKIKWYGDAVRALEKEKCDGSD